MRRSLPLTSACVVVALAVACTARPAEHDALTRNPVDKSCVAGGETIAFPVDELGANLEEACADRPAEFVKNGEETGVEGDKPRRTAGGYEVTVPPSLPPGTYFVVLHCLEKESLSNTFQVPCADAGSDAAVDPGTDGGREDGGGGGGRDGGSSGVAFTLSMPKKSTLNGGSVTSAALAKVLLTASAGNSNVTLVDPAAPDAARQVVIDDVTVTSAVERPDGAIVVAGFLPALTPWVGLLRTDDTFAWARDLGVGAGRSSQIALLGANGVAVAFGGGLRVGVLDISGSGPTVVTFTTPSSTYARSLAAITPVTPRVPTDNAGYFVGAEVERTFPEQDLVVFSMTATNTIAWQKLFANGGRNFLHTVVPLDDGGALVVGGIRPPGQGAFDGWLARLSSTGSLTWQRTYEPGARVAFKSAMPVAGGYRVLGSTTAGLVLLDVATDGTPIRAAAYADTGATAKPQPLGMALGDNGGTILAGVEATTHTYTVVQAAADLTVASCADPLLGVGIPTTSSNAAPTMTLSDASFSVGVSTPTSNVVPLTVARGPAVASAGLCAP